MIDTNKIIEFKVLNDVDSAIFCAEVTYGNKIKNIPHSINTMLLGKHSPMKEVRYRFVLECSERTHTHLVRHERIGKYVRSHRRDRNKNAQYKPSNGTEERLIEDLRSLGFEVIKDSRIMCLTIDALLFVHMCGQRLCKSASLETTEIVKMMVKEVLIVHPFMETYCVRPCVWYGFCSERMTQCRYIHTFDFQLERDRLIKESEKK
jgi:thymidylate synthase ThyX